MKWTWSLWNGDAVPSPEDTQPSTFIIGCGNDRSNYMLYIGKSNSEIQENKTEKDPYWCNQGCGNFKCHANLHREPVEAVVWDHELFESLRRRFITLITIILMGWDKWMDDGFINSVRLTSSVAVKDLFSQDAATARKICMWFKCQVQIIVYTYNMWNHHYQSRPISKTRFSKLFLW